MHAVAELQQKAAGRSPRQTVKFSSLHSIIYYECRTKVHRKIKEK